MTSLSMGESNLNLSQAFKEYKWYNSCNVMTDLQCNILRLELPIDMKASSTTTTATSTTSNSSLYDDGNIIPSDIYISIQIICNQIPLFEYPISTCFSHNTTTNHSIRNIISWNDLVSFPLKYRDLSKDALMVFTAYTGGDNQKIIGGSSMPLFNENQVLKQGKQKLIFYFNSLGGDANVIMNLNSTPGQLYDSYAHLDDDFKTEKLLETYHYNHHMSGSSHYSSNSSSNSNNNAYNINFQTRWLDALTYNRIQSVLAATTTMTTATTTTSGVSGKESCAATATNIGKCLWGRSAAELDLLHLCCLVIELPVSDYPIIYEEKVYSTVQPHFPLLRIDDIAAGCVRSTGSDSLAGASGDESVSGSRGSGILEFSLVGSASGHSLFNPRSICVVADWELDQENLAEAQYRCLAHDSIRGAADPKIKPNLQEKECIDRLVSAASDRLTNDEMDLFYKFRYALTDNKKALIKLLCSINWSVESEVRELPVLLSMWKSKAPIDVSDALKLLGREKSFQHPMVRQYAVQTLQTASDEELSLYLLQLVQALRYEPEGVFVMIDDDDDDDDDDRDNEGAQDNDDPSVTAVEAVSVTTTTTTTTTPNSSGSNVSMNVSSTETIKLSPLAHFLIQRACASPMLANSFYWFVKVELKDPINGNRFFNVLQSFLITLNQHCTAMNKSHTNNNNNDDEDEDDENNAKDNDNNTNNNKTVTTNTNNTDNNNNNNNLYQQILAQDDYITNIIRAQQDAKNVGGAKPQKEAELRRLLHVRHLAYIPSSVTYLPNPLNPTIKMVGLVPTTATMFKSAVYPCVIDFITTSSSNNTSSSDITTTATAAAAVTVTGIATAVSSNVSTLTHMHNIPLSKSIKTTTHTTASTHTSGTSGGVVKIMFKSGDDLRQDQLVMQLMQLMDRLLRKVNLNLQLLTYHVLAVTHNDGIMEFVADSYAFSAILAEHRTVQAFLKKYNPDTTTATATTGSSGSSAGSSCYGISPVVMDTYVKSCAASCVVTFILGIGDRHLDNIMMTKKGQLFHIDFGFIFGQDPKPLPPPFRFTREMCDGMGGEDSEHYDKFKGYCCQAYNWLRKSANLILNLLSLMGDAGIEDISLKSDINKVLARVEEKFRLDLTDEMAEQYFLGLINESLNAFAPRVMEVLHQIAVKRR